MDIMHIISHVLLLAGLIIGLGAVTVIDLHGWLGRKSGYWTLATTRTHKVTKPLIWFGILLAIIGGVGVFGNESLESNGIARYLLIDAVLLLLNGCYLSFVISPLMLRREKQGKDSEVLPKAWQYRIAASMMVSFVSWWSAVLMIAWWFATR
jgi:hypothetical protein